MGIGNNIDESMINQVIGGQSMLFRIFKEIFKEAADDIKKEELTYFILSVFTYVYLRLSNFPEHEKETLTDRVSLEVLAKSLPHFSKALSPKKAVFEYQKRYGEYSVLINSIFKADGIDNNECISLTIHVFESVVQKTAKNKMVEVYVASPLVAQFIVDFTEFIRNSDQPLSEG